MSSVKKTDSKEFDNISITAYRIISILNMLLAEPLSDEELNIKLQENIQGARTLSKDTIGIYINTLRAIGCEILRPTKNNGYKYVLKSHPFKLNISKEEISSLVEIKKYISTTGNWKLAIETDDLFNKIVNIITSECKNDFVALKNMALCREINSENLLLNLTSIEKYCEKNKDLLIIYNSPNSGEKEINLKAEKLALENGAFYLWGYNYEINETVYLRVDRIKSIAAVSIKDGEKKEKGIEVKYKITGASAISYTSSKYDKISRKSETEIHVTSLVLNKFKFIQDVLSYGADCTVISPDYIRNDIIASLEAMSKTYQDVYIA
jgi:predicted DNA-binding transcriptional regulator YafY